MQFERFLQRDRAYGVWHRARSIARYLGFGRAAQLSMLDLDSVLFTEYDALGKTPLCLIEVAMDIGQDKPAGVIRRLAAMAGIPAYVALYTPAPHMNPTNVNWKDIERFRIQRIWPHPEKGWRDLSPGEWADALVRIRGWQMRRFEEMRTAANDDRF